jgi:hypothetical protein
MRLFKSRLVRLELGLAGPTGADAPRALEVGPHPPEARREVFVLGELDLQTGLPGLRATREDVEDQLRAVDHADAPALLEVADLSRREVVVDDHRVRMVALHLGADLLDLPAAEEGRRVGSRAVLDDARADNLGVGGDREALGLFQVLADVEAGPRTRGRRRGGARAQRRGRRTRPGDLLSMLGSPGDGQPVGDRFLPEGDPGDARPVEDRGEKGAPATAAHRGNRGGSDAAGSRASAPSVASLATVSMFTSPTTSDPRNRDRRTARDQNPISRARRRGPPSSSRRPFAATSGTSAST